MAKARFEPSAVLTQVLNKVQRTLGSKPPRTAQVRLTPLGGLPPDKTTINHKTARGIRADLLADSFVQAWEQSRIQRYQDYREIEEETPELAKAIDVWVGLMFADPKQAFEIQYADNARPEVQRIIEMTRADLQLDDSIRRTAHEGLWLGDSFWKLIYGDLPMRIVSMDSLAPERVRIMEGEFHHIAFYEETSPGSTEPERLHPFLVVHYAARRLKGSRYGRSMLHSARWVRRSHDVFSDILAMLGLRKASGDVYFVMPMPDSVTKEKESEWIQGVQDGAETESGFDRQGHLRRKAAANLDTVPKIIPYRVVTDENGGVAYDGKPQIAETKAADFGQIVQVLQHFQERFFIATGVPAALVGGAGSDNARATVEVQGVHVGIAIRWDQHDIAQVIDEIFTRACLVQGVVPEPGEWIIVMPSPGAFDEKLKADVFASRSAGVYSLVQAGTPLRQALKEGFDYDEETLDQIQDQLQKDAIDADAVLKAIEMASTKGLRVVIEGGRGSGG